MIRTKFMEWVEKTINELEKLNITTEVNKHKNPDESNVPDPNTGIVHESNVCLGQVIVWESRQMEFEVVNISTEEMLLWKYIEKLPDKPDFDLMLEEYFHVLQTGFKP